MEGQTARILSLTGEAAKVEGTDALRETLQGLLTREGITQAQIARESGLTAPVFSGWLKGSYSGDNQAVERKLRQWLEARDRKAQAANTLPEAPGWLETPTSQKILGVLLYAQLAGDIGVIYGAAGLGKTSTLKAYASQAPNVWLMTMSPDTAHVCAALEEIAEALGLRGIPGRAARLRRELVRRLRDTAGVLVIDEAQHLNISALEAIRALHDASGIGLVLCGNESVYARLTGGSRAATFAQLFSRIGKRLLLTRPHKGDVKMLAESFGVSGNLERQALAEIAAKPGGLRGVVKVLRLASMFSAGDGQPLCLEHIRAAWRDLGGER